jgi:hypothetical protein
MGGVRAARGGALYVAGVEELRSRSVTSAAPLEPRIVPLFAIPLATCLALQLLPPDPSVPGAMTLVFWVLALGILAGTAADLTLGGVRRAFHAQNILYAGLIVIGFIEGLQGSYSIDLGTENISRTILAIGIFGTAVAVGSLLPRAKPPASVLAVVGSEYSPRQLWRVTLACFGLAMLAYAIPSGFSPVKMAEGVTMNRWAAPWAGSYLGGWPSFYQHLAYFGYLLPALTAMLAVRRGSWLDARVTGGVVCSLVFLLFDSQSGGRRGPVAYLGAGVLTWLVARVGRLRVTHWIGVLGLVAVTALFTDLMLKVRDVGLHGASYDVTSFHELRADDNFRLLTYTVQAVPEEHPYVGWTGVYFFLAYPFPRALWPGKPVDMGFDLAQHVGARGVSFSMTAAGEFYIMFGWPGLIAGGMLLGWLASWWTQILERSNTLIGAGVYALGAMVLFSGMRSLLVLIETAYPILGLVVLHRCFFRALRKPRVLRIPQPSPGAPA